MDKITKEHRSWNMSRILSKNTKPEIMVRKLVHQMGYRFRLHRTDLPGKPDIVFSKKKKVIFVHGCFWHAHECQHFRWPATNEEFWASKLKHNAIRDKEVLSLLIDSGWTCLIVWECACKQFIRSNQLSELTQIKQGIEQFLDESNFQSMEIDLNGIHELMTTSEVGI